MHKSAWFIGIVIVYYPRMIEAVPLTTQFRSRLLVALFRGSLGIACLLGSAALAQAPTAQLPAEELAEQWKQASSSHDSARNAILQDVERVDHAGPYRADWGSLAGWNVPDWYKDAKFGIFIHWGVYSVPAFDSEWYPRMMYMEGSADNKHQVATYGPLTSFGYKDFIPMFKAEHYDPAAWARLFKQSGAKYVVPVFEHHDGFQMYDSALSDWNAAKMGPHRDLVGDLAKAVRAEGLHLGASSHRIEHDWFMDGGRKFPSDVNDPKNAAFYGPAQMQVVDGTDKDGSNLSQDWTFVSPAYGEDWLARSAEIVQKYHPDFFFFDWWIGQPSVRPYVAKFAAYYYNKSQKTGPVGVISYKWVDMEAHSGLLDIERGQLAEIRPDYWQTDTSVSNKSWGYIEHDTFKTPKFIIHQLADVISKNGNLLMNIGPRADGTIPDEVQSVLRSVGEWLTINGDAVYGTRPWKSYGEGPTKVVEGSFHDAETKPFTGEDYRFTTKGDNLYAIELGPPANGHAVIHSLGANALTGFHIKSITLLGSSGELKYRQSADALTIALPAHPATEPAYVYRIELDGPAAPRTPEPATRANIKELVPRDFGTTESE
jgi:alpha-L-fucosidase